MWITAVLIMLAMGIRAIAAVSIGPKAEDATQEEQRRISQFFEAQKSVHKKLEVGQERYDARQANRSKAIEAMAAELTTRQETVVIHSVAAPCVKGGEPETWSGPLLGLGALGAGFLGFRYYRSRQRVKGLVGRKGECHRLFVHEPHRATGVGEAH